jgi:Mg-chelatase subunit ChlD
MATRLNRRRANTLAALVVAGLVAFLLFWQFSPSEYEDKSLLELLVELRAEYEAPGLTIAEAAKSLENSQAAFEFVRDRVRYSPYQGNLQDPAGVLRTRVGNVQDRALLLFALLGELGESTRLVASTSRELPEEVAPAPGMTVVARSTIVTEIGRRIGYDFDLETSEISQIDADLAAYAQRTGSQVEQTQNLIGDVANLSASRYLPGDWEDYDRDWLWVEVGEGEAVKVFDPSFPDLERPDKLAISSDDLDPVATNEIRLFVENRAGFREQLLAWEGAPFGQDIALSFLPAQNLNFVLDSQFEPEQVLMWTPTLQVGEQIILGEPVSVNGDHVGFVPGPAPYAPEGGARSDVEITRANLVRVDARNFPTIRVLIDVETVDERAWFARDFVLSENETERAIRIKSVALDPRPVVAVTDVSGSMEEENRLAQSQIALKALIEALGPRVPFGLISFAFNARAEIEIAKLGDGLAARDVVEGLQIRGDTALLVGLNAGLDQIGELEGTIIMLTDGEDAVGGDLEATLSRLARSKTKVIAIGLGDQPDEVLMRQFAQASGGEYVRFTEGDNLTSIYAALGSSLSGLLAIEYETELNLQARVTEISAAGEAGTTENEASETIPPTSPVASEGNDIRQITLAISGLNSGDLSGEYIAPEQLGPDPRLVLEITSGRADSRQTVSRTLTHLKGPVSGWNLAGLSRIYFDLGRSNPSVLFAGYITNWINALLLEPDDPDLQQEPELSLVTGSERTSLEYVTTIGGIRTLADAPGSGDLLYSPGPNIYLERRRYGPGDGEPVAINSFDIMQVWGRGIGPLARTADAMALEISATFAEGLMIDGVDSVFPLLENADGLNLVSPGGSIPDSWSDELRRQAMSRQLAATSWIYANQVPNIAWNIDPAIRGFRAFVDSSGLVAKGASIARIAQQFDRLDKMYAAYAALASWGGKAAGVNGISPLIAMIAAFKREENKLWCYSTIVLGYVNESIGDPDATLNRSPQEAIASAASLCKMDYSPDEFGERAVMAAATAGARSWGKDRFKDFMKSQGFSLGAAIVDAYSNGGKIRSIGNAFLPMTPGFHTLMNNAVTAR